MKKRLLILLAVMVLLLCLTACDSADYAKAEDALANGDYDTAIEIWTELDDYKDSGDRVLEAQYAKAADLLQSEDYDAAIEIFADLGGYSDAAIRVQEATYAKAQALSETDPEAALSLLCTIPDYQDVTDAIQEIGLRLFDGYIQDADLTGLNALLTQVEPLVVEICKDDIISSLVALVPSQADYLKDPADFTQEQQPADERSEENDGGEKTEDQLAADTAVEVVNSMMDVLETLGTTDDALYGYLQACSDAYSALIEYSTVQMLCQQFPAVDESLGALAEAKNVSDQMKKTYEDLSEIDWEGLEYDPDNDLQQSIVDAWKGIMDGCYTFMEGYDSRSVTEMESGVTSIKDALSLLETLNDSIDELKNAYDVAYQSIPAVPTA